MISATTSPATQPVNGIAIQRIWAELTGNCQLACIHCYADSGHLAVTGR
jgi:hypothetical protein